MEAETSHSEQDKLLESRSSEEESAADQIRELLEGSSSSHRCHWHKFTIVGLTIALVASNLLWASFPSTIREPALADGESTAYYGSPAMVEIAFDHDWRGLLDSENDTYLYRQDEWGDKLFPAIYFLNGTMSEWPDEGGFIWDHVLHCMDAVRQGLACNLDPTLIPLSEVWPGIPNGQVHFCRNRDALRAWCNERGHDIPVDPRTQD
ncbi:hypothetical protein PRZ48_015264 [Zasmidium cellare]|uniref:Uncharacterized protein n=1 Tax=Zasmidium cellare TaxID=395010 RepID=A0ABR0DWR2_ZASCE|nr:hypothetical protein PRZ48_015264 [Zasmidium cellare]